MSANVSGRMVYSFEKPMWHNITDPCLVPMTAEEVLDLRFGGGQKIYLRPVTLELNGEQVETGDFGIVRSPVEHDPNEVVFGYCSDKYNPLQPRDVANSFDTNVAVNVETMAFLGKGEEMFISWKMPSCDVRVGDTVDFYGIVRTGFDTLKGTRLFTSVYRPVCQNTINLAQGWAQRHTDGQGKGNIWKGKGVNRNLLRDLGYWMAHVQANALREVTLLQSLFSSLAEKPVESDTHAHTLLEQAYPYAGDVSDNYPPELRENKQETTLEFNQKQGELRNGIFELFSGAGTAITPDYWGMLCATSEYFCHVQSSKKPIAESVMFGNRQANIMRMVKVLAE